MPRQMPIFYSALLLTGVNLLLRFVGTSFQVTVSAALGPEGVGLLQLVMSVGSLSMVAGMAGIRTSAMYLTAEELGRDKPQNVLWVLSGCFSYSILCSGAVAAILWIFAPQIAAGWIGDGRTAEALRLFAAFLPAVCLCGVMTGYFTAANRIGTLAAVEVAEQLASMAITIGTLRFWADRDPVRACMSVIFGSSMGSCLTLLCLSLLRLREPHPGGARIPLASRLRATAVPLAVADVLKSGITTTETLMVPKRLALHAATDNPLAAFGIVSGMVFPLLMFPACILFGLAELLIPELARCAAGNRSGRIRYLVQRSLKVSLLYGLLFSGLLYLLSDALCEKLYGSAEAGRYLRLYALLIPMLYCDAITDAMTKGLGQQKACVRYNILSSALDVGFLYFLLPKYGMDGYFASFLITHLVNFLLSLRRLTKISGIRISFHIPAFSLSAALISLGLARVPSQPVLQCGAFLSLLMCLLALFRIIGQEDYRWFSGLIRQREKSLTS